MFNDTMKRGGVTFDDGTPYKWTNDELTQLNLVGFRLSIVLTLNFSVSNETDFDVVHFDMHYPVFYALCSPSVLRNGGNFGTKQNIVHEEADPRVHHGSYFGFFGSHMWCRSHLAVVHLSIRR